MKSIILILIVSIIGFLKLYDQQVDVCIKNSTWVHDYYNGYADTLSFTDSTYVLYTSEVDYRKYGSYNQVEDSLILIEKGDFFIKAIILKRELRNMF